MKYIEILFYCTKKATDFLIWSPIVRKSWWGLTPSNGAGGMTFFLYLSYFYSAGRMLQEIKDGLDIVTNSKTTERPPGDCGDVWKNILETHLKMLTFFYISGIK